MNERIGASPCPERDLLDPFAVRIVSFSVWLDYFPCYGRRNSLFWSLGNLPVSTCIPSVTGAQSGSLSPHFVKFPVNFPVSRGISSGDRFDTDCIRHHAVAREWRNSRDGTRS